MSGFPCSRKIQTSKQIIFFNKRLLYEMCARTEVIPIVSRFTVYYSHQQALWTYDSLLTPKLTGDAYKGQLAENRKPHRNHHLP